MNLKRKFESANGWQLVKRQKMNNEQTNATIEEVISDEETIAFVAEEDMKMGDPDDDDLTVISDDEETVVGDADVSRIVFDESEIGQYSSFDDYDGINDERVLYYDWLADSVTTSHICNRREAFVHYQPANGKTVAGVGNLKAPIGGQGTVELRSKYGEKTYKLQLENIMYIPSNKKNLLSLGQWDQNGQTYIGGGGKLTLKDTNGVPVATGIKIHNNLYKMSVTNDTTDTDNLEATTFAATGSKPSWETWHHHFGHISYDGLQKLLQKKLVEGFEVSK